ncbi:MAG: HAMP domain-containing histidine kinase [Clostridiales bacterium]|nr:HAMP domain-containing histidine kinase [Clostridiales bacterium]
MKLSTKLFLGIFSVIAFTILIFGYFILFVDFDKNLNYQIDNGTREFQGSSQIISQYYNALNENLDHGNAIALAAYYSDKANTDHINLYTYTKEPVFTGITYTLPQDFLDHTESNRYKSITVDGRKIIVFTGVITVGNSQYILQTLKDVTDVYNNADSLRNSFIIILISSLAISFVIAFVFSRIISSRVEHVRKTSEAMASGDYKKRITIKTKDEFADMAESYNKMADTIEEKISELEDSVQKRDDFIAAFSHEMKTPLTSIIGYADMIYHNNACDKDTKEAANYILNEGLRLEKLSFNLLNLITMDNTGINKESIPTEELFDDLSNVYKSINQDITLTYNYDKTYINIEYDLIKTVLTNLIDNALKSNTDRIEISGKETNKGYTFQVKDHGMGIPEEDLKRVTEAFYMVDKSRSRKAHGAGLGLALCDRIVKLHGSQLDIQSKPNEGTTVQFTIAKD